MKPRAASVWGKHSSTELRRNPSCPFPSVGLLNVDSTVSRALRNKFLFFRDYQPQVFCYSITQWNKTGGYPELSTEVEGNHTGH